MTQHDEFMLRAIELAKQGKYTTHPNPLVGCVIVNGDWLVGEGWHERAGEPHAEVNAIAQAKERGADLKDATVYVTLEPCAHQGRTGPCCEALVKEGVAKVIIAMQDPNPQVQGKGIAYLKAHGVEVLVGVQEQAARDLNIGFITRMQTGLPYVQLKLAASLDGRTAMASGESQWITCPAAREDVQKYRAQAGAIITGSGTFYDDKPSLTVRPHTWQLAQYSAHEQAVTSEDVRQPLRVVMSSQVPQGDLSNQPIFTDGVSSVWAGHNASTYKQYPSHIQALDLPSIHETAEQAETLKYLLAQLAKEHDVNRVWIEAGAKLSAAFVQADLVDEFILYYAPCLMGSEARPMFDLPFSTMAERLQLKIKSVRQVGETVRMCAHPLST